MKDMSVMKKAAEANEGFGMQEDAGIFQERLKKHHDELRWLSMEL